MPVDNRWYVEDRILLTTLKGRVTIEEMLESGLVGTQMIDSGTAPVYVLVDLSELEHFPTRLNEVKQLSDQGTSANLALSSFTASPTG